LSKPKRMKALFTKDNVPPGGTCLSSFLAVTDGPRVLVGKMSEPDVWAERFFVRKEMATDYVKSDKYIVPGSHLAWYESPLDAARGIMRDQVGKSLPASRFRLNGVQSHLRGDISSSENPAHWDICFIYEVRLTPKEAKSLKSPEWFKDFGFRPRSSLRADDFTRGHGDVLAEAGIINA
jgi:hypothetical protein